MQARRRSGPPRCSLRLGLRNGRLLRRGRRVGAGRHRHAHARKPRAWCPQGRTVRPASARREWLKGLAGGSVGSAYSACRPAALGEHAGRCQDGACCKGQRSKGRDLTASASRMSRFRGHSSRSLNGGSPRAAETGHGNPYSEQRWYGVDDRGEICALSKRMRGKALTTVPTAADMQQGVGSAPAIGTQTFAAPCGLRGDWGRVVASCDSLVRPGRGRRSWRMRPRAHSRHWQATAPGGSFRRNRLCALMIAFRGPEISAGRHRRARQCQSRRMASS